MSGLRVSVVIPTYNGAKTLANCLGALSKAVGPGDEIIVVDDASLDNSAQLAQGLGCRVLRLEKNGGAAKARNQGARAATGEIIFFTDDDVVVSPRSIEQLKTQFADAKVAGVVGVLAAQIPFANFASQLKNLWMRFSYLTCPSERVGLFFTSAAAIRKDIFFNVGGFDENYHGASIAEDTDFGQRAWEKGHLIRIDPQLSVSHHKHYSIGEVLKTDFQRAQALTHMRLRKAGQAFYTSVPFSYQLSVPVLGAAALFGVLTLAYPPLAWGGLTFSFFFYLLVARWLIFLFQNRGWGFGLTAVLFQPLDTLAVGAGMATACLRHLFGKRF